MFLSDQKYSPSEVTKANLRVKRNFFIYNEFVEVIEVGIASLDIVVDCNVLMSG